MSDRRRPVQGGSRVHYARFGGIFMIALWARCSVPACFAKMTGVKRMQMDTKRLPKREWKRKERPTRPTSCSPRKPDPRRRLQDPGPPLATCVLHPRHFVIFLFTWYGLLLSFHVFWGVPRYPPHHPITPEIPLTISSLW